MYPLTKFIALRYLFTLFCERRERSWNNSIIHKKSAVRGERERDGVTHIAAQRRSLHLAKDVSNHLSVKKGYIQYSIFLLCDMKLMCTRKCVFL